MGRLRGDEIKFVLEVVKQKTIGQIRDFSLNYIRGYGRSRPIPIIELINEMRKKLDILRDEEARKYLAFWEGIKGEITNAIHIARKKNKEPFLMIKGSKRDKVKRGYMYGDHKCKVVGETWMKRYREWKSRKYKWDEEKILDLKIIDKVLEKLEDYEERQKLKEVRTLYVKEKTRKKKLEE